MLIGGGRIGANTAALSRLVRRLTLPVRNVTITMSGHVMLHAR